jgi:hypothetical protein
MLQQRYVIRSLLKASVLPRDIPDRLSRVYGEDAMKNSQLFFCFQEVERGREEAAQYLL